MRKWVSGQVAHYENTTLSKEKRVDENENQQFVCHGVQLCGEHFGIIDQDSREEQEKKRAVRESMISIWRGFPWELRQQTINSVGL